MRFFFFFFFNKHARGHNPSNFTRLVYLFFYLETPSTIYNTKVDLNLGVGTELYSLEYLTLQSISDATAHPTTRPGQAILALWDHKQIELTIQVISFQLYW